MSRRPPFTQFKINVGVVIRPAEAGDLPALEWMGLYTRHRAIITETFSAQQRGDALMLLALTDGFPVGQVWIDFARKRAEGIAVLWAVRTFHPLHGTGIGRRLMTAAEQELRRRGISRAELGVERTNEDAQHFYEKLGWRIVGPLQESYRYVTPDGVTIEESLDEWLMAKELTARPVAKRHPTKGERPASPLK